jgi:branched-chain amino acid aminotransferase
MKLVWFNGSFTRLRDIPASTLERLWKYGDGGFETLLYIQSEIPLYALHAKRAHEHASLLEAELQLPDYSELKNITKTLAEENEIGRYGRMRLTWFRTHGGLYVSDEKNTQILIELQAFDFENINRNLKAILYTDQPSAPGILSPYKKPGSAVYADALRKAKKAGAEEAILLNTSGEIAETATGNLLLRTGNQYTAPPSHAGGIEGIMLQHLSKKLPEWGYSFRRKTITFQDLRQADEILMINALRGISLLTVPEYPKISMESLLLNKLLFSI